MCATTRIRDPRQLRMNASAATDIAVAQAIIKQNMCLALGSIAALALPVLLGWLPLWVAVTLHEGSTLLVALNSLRLLRWEESPEAELAIRDAAASVQQPVNLALMRRRDHDSKAVSVSAAAAA